MTPRRREPCNDIGHDEDPRVVTVATAMRQARESVPYDPWEWKACTQDDVDRARELLAVLDSGGERP